jgi:hypothetical protein
MGKLCHMRRTFWCYPTIFSEVSSDCVDELGSLPHQQVTGPKDETCRLLLLALHRHEAHVRPLRCFANSLSVDRVVLLPLHERLYISRRDQPNLMPKLGELASPVMRSTTRLKRYSATRLRREEVQKLSSADPLAEKRSPLVVHSMCVENMFSDIQTQVVTFDTDASLKWCSNTPLWHIDAVGGASTPS